MICALFSSGFLGVSGDEGVVELESFIWKGVARFGGGKSQMLQPQRLRKVVNSQSLTRASSKILCA